MRMKYCLPPIADGTARALILGSLPGERSLAAQRYYDHPRNQFWHLMERVLARPLIHLDYQARLAVLRHSGIALWDVVATATRRGSLDQSLATVVVNDVAALAARLPHLSLIAYNGAKAAQLGKGLVVRPSMTVMTLPSSSAANCMTLEDKAARWRGIARYLAGEFPAMVSPAGFEPATY